MGTSLFIATSWGHLSRCLPGSYVIVVVLSENNWSFNYFAALVDKIYTAQKERDTAVMARLKMANDERDETLERLKRIERDRG